VPDSSLAPLESLLDRTEANDAQLWLTLGEVGFSPVKVDRTGPKKRYTGAVLFRQNPALYRAIVVLGAEPGVSINRICEIVHCTDDTVKAVLAREPRAVAEQKKHLLNEGQLCRRATLERLNELAPNMTAKDAALTFGIVTDKVELLSGGVTSRVEVTDGAAVLKRFLDLHERIEKTVRGRVIDAGEIGSDEQNSAANSDRSPAPGAGPSAPITSDNEYHIKSDSVGVERLTDADINADDSIIARPMESPRSVPLEPGAAADRAGGVAAPREGSEPHRLTQPEIL